MTVTQRRIKELRVRVVECPKLSIGSFKIGGMVRIEGCRRCKFYGGEHGGEYIECTYEGATLRMIEEKDGVVK